LVFVLIGPRRLALSSRAVAIMKILFL